MDTGQGTTLSIGGSTIGKVKRISLPDYNRNMVDVTNLSSSNSLKEYIPGFGDNGPLTFTTYAEPLAASDAVNNYPEILDNLGAAAAVEVIVTFPNSTTATFSGYITGFRPNIGGEEEVIESEVTIKPTTAVVYA